MINSNQSVEGGGFDFKCSKFTSKMNVPVHLGTIELHSPLLLQVEVCCPCKTFLVGHEKVQTLLRLLPSVQNWMVAVLESVSMSSSNSLHTTSVGDMIKRVNTIWFPFYDHK